MTALAATYERSDKPEEALTVYEGLIATYPSSKNAMAFYTKARDLAFATGASVKSKSYQAKIDELLRAEKK